MDSVIDRLREQYGCPIWRSKDGSLVPIKIMSNGHLGNACRKLEAIATGEREPDGWYWQIDGMSVSQSTAYWISTLHNEIHRRTVLQEAA